MTCYRSILLCGGDRRQLCIAQALREEGDTVYTLGLDDAEAIPWEHVARADVIILPLPCSKDGIHLFAPLCKTAIPLEELFGRIQPSQLVFGGKCQNLPAYQHRIYDYYSREELMILNAIPTAEGAVQLAMESMDTTVWGCRTLILGYGRIGKVLAETFSHLGARVTVEARKPDQITWIALAGYQPLWLEDLAYSIDAFDLIINTVPYPLLDAGLLQKTKKSVLIIDLASCDGLDYDAAAAFNRRAVHALSLPGKVAPKTAGIFIKDTIMNMLREREV